MDASSESEIIHALRRLTKAVWALVVVFAAFVVLYAAGMFLSTPSGDLAPQTSRHESIDIPIEARDFLDAPIEEKIRESTVIVLARHQSDGSHLRCSVSEILKHAPGIEFNFKVGDDLQWCDHDIEPDTTYGDGQIIFFQGNPARPRFSTTFEGDRLNDMGGTPIELIRDMIKAEAN